MRIVVASARSPFPGPGALGTADELALALGVAGHQVEQVWLSVDPDPERAVQRRLAARLTDVSDAGEVLIALRAPSHLLRHPHKVLWFEGEVGSARPDAAADRVGVAEARRVIATSLAGRRQLRSVAAGEVPVLGPERLTDDPAGVVAALLG